jgi:hypothetical protein
MENTDRQVQPPGIKACVRTTATAVLLLTTSIYLKQRYRLFFTEFTDAFNTAEASSPQATFLLFKYIS